MIRLNLMSGLGEIVLLLMALMAFPAFNVFHSIATSCWESTNSTISAENTPLLFTGVGDYKCTVKAGYRVFWQFTINTMGLIFFNVMSINTENHGILTTNH